MPPGLIPDIDRVAEIREAYDAYNAAAEAAEEELRQALIRFAPMICGCTRTFAWGSGIAPQASCPLHSQQFLRFEDLGL